MPPRLHQRFHLLHHLRKLEGSAPDYKALWEDLSDKIEDISLSQVDQDLLDHRLTRIKNGEAEILKWDEVKHSIGEV